jgi:hypothetical protein
MHDFVCKNERAILEIFFPVLILKNNYIQLIFINGQLKLLCFKCCESLMILKALL